MRIANKEIPLTHYHQNLEENNNLDDLDFKFYRNLNSFDKKPSSNNKGLIQKALTKEINNFKEIAISLSQSSNPTILEEDLPQIQNHIESLKLKRTNYNLDDLNDDLDDMLFDLGIYEIDKYFEEDF